MSYFKNFPYLVYTLDNKTEVVTDILVRSTFIEKIKSNIAVFREYYITDMDTPESVAQKFYGSVFLYWIALLFNEIHDPTFEWPLNQNELYEFCSSTYGVEGMNDVRFYERNGIVVGEYREYDYSDIDFIWIPPIKPVGDNIIPVTHYEFEERKNDLKRNIKIPREELVDEIIKQFTESLK